MEKLTQNDYILQTLQDANGEYVPVTHFLQQYITRTAARIKNLRDLGYEIEGRRVSGKPYYEYRLVPKEARQLNFEMPAPENMMDYYREKDL